MSTPDDRWEWATVTTEVPLRVTLDTETVEVDASPTPLVAGLQVGDRVRVQIVDRRLIVFGRAYGVDAPPAGMMQAGQASLTLYTDNTTSVSFSPAFTAAPRVFVTFVTDTETAVISASVQSVTTSGATIRIRSSPNWGGSFTFNWLAVPNGATAL